MIRRLLCGKTIKIGLKFRPETTFDNVNSILMYAVCGEIKRRIDNGEEWYTIYVYPYHMKSLFKEAERNKIFVIVED